MQTKLQKKYRSLILLLIIGIFLTPAAARAQTITATATLDTSSINIGEAARLDIAVKGQALASEPVIENIDGLEIQTLGRSSSTSYVNGQYSAVTIYSYQIIGWKQGSYTLGPYEVKVKKDKVMTNAVTLQVNSVNSVGKSSTSQIPDDSSPFGDKLFMEMELGKTRLFLGEKIPLKIRVYYSELNIDEMSYPVIDQTAFIFEQMNKPSQRKTTINGRSYQVVEFSTSISPLRTGQFELGPAQLNCSILIKQQGGDLFFSRFRKYSLELKSNQVKLDVLPLPPGEPVNFSGGIGQFQIQVSGQPTEVLQGEPVTLRLTVTGNGNLQAVNAPQLKKVDGLKVYDPQKKSEPGATGQVQFEQVVIPVDPEVKEIGPFQLGYFDPSQGKYRQAVAPAIPVKVKPNPNFNTVQIADAGESEENYGRDLIYIKERLGNLKRRNEGLIYQKWFWWLQLVPLLGLGMALGYRRYRRILLSDSPWSRAVRAGNLAAKGLAKAKAELTVKPENTLETLHSIIREYLGARYGLTTAGMTGTVVEQIAAFGINPETLREIKEFFDQYDYYRFTGSKIDSAAVGQLWEKVNRIIKNLDQGNGLINKKGKAPERRGRSERF